jgi:hypothetical protein
VLKVREVPLEPLVVRKELKELKELRDLKVLKD